MVLFMAITRTQVGRDSLRAELERQFNNYFKGEIRIGELQGNMLNTLYARNILLLDENEVLVGSIESAIIRPKWYEILSRTVSLDGISLYQPEFDFLYRSDSTWNIVSLFSPKQRGVQSPPWAFSSADIRIINGELTTRSETETLPESIANGAIFDYANTSVESLQSRLVIDWDDSIRFIEFNHLSGEMVNPSMNIDEVEGQFVWLEDGIELSQVEVIFGSSRLRLDGLINGLSVIHKSPDSTRFDVEINTSEIHNNDLADLFPQYPIPFPYTISGSIQGPFNEISLQTLDITNEQFELHLDGSVLGLPDSMIYNLNVSNSTLSEEALDLLLPQITPYDIQFINNLSFNSNGRVLLDKKARPTAFNVEGIADFQYGMGSISTNFRLDRDEKDSLSYQTAIEVDSLDLGPIIPQNPSKTLITGKAQLRGNHSTGRTPTMDLAIALSPTTIDAISLDTLNFTASLFNQSLHAIGSTTLQDKGFIALNTNFDLSRPQNPFELDLETRNLNAGTLFNSDSLSSDLNVSIAVEGKGTTWDELRGLADIRFRPSSLSSAEHSSSIPANNIAVSFEDISANRQYFKISGEDFDFNTTGFLRPSMLKNLYQFWNPVLRNKVAKEIQKPRAISQLATASLDNLPFEDMVEALYLENLLDQIGTSLADVSPDSSLHIRMESTIRDATLLNSLFLKSPQIQTNAYTIVDLVASPKDFSITGILHADSLVMSETSVFLPDLALDLSGELDEQMEPPIDGPT